MRSFDSLIKVVTVACAFRLIRPTTGAAAFLSTAKRHHDQSHQRTTAITARRGGFVSSSLPSSSTTTATSLSMVMNRGLEQKRESATPTEGGMTLYLKAGPDGTSVGDCPFAHYVRLVLEEKGLEYELKPSVAETKPSWLIDFYEGKMPALRHRKECYVDSDVIAQYLDFFFQNPPLKVSDTQLAEQCEAAVTGIFPAIAKYLKHTPDGDADDLELKSNLEACLAQLDDHLQKEASGGPYMAGSLVSLMDCSLAPKLYHMQTGLEAFKANAIIVETQFPAVAAYMDTVFARDSFQKTVYPKEVVTWGWGNARKAA